MIIIGVTGGIGSGKSSVSSILKDLGALIIDADKLSHDVVEVNRPAYNKIVQEFGTEILNKDLSINRKKLGEIVFNEHEKRLKLEAIVHAEVVNEILNQIDRLKKSGYDDLVVLDVPIPVEHGFLDIVDRVWVVTACEENQIKRVQMRDGLTKEEILRRIHSQISQQDYISLADDIIKNDGTIESLKEKVKVLLNKLNDN